MNGGLRLSLVGQVGPAGEVGLWKHIYIAHNNCMLTSASTREEDACFPSMTVVIPTLPQSYTTFCTSNNKDGEGAWQEAPALLPTRTRTKPTSFPLFPPLPCWNLKPRGEGNAGKELNEGTRLLLHRSTAAKSQLSLQGNNCILTSASISEEDACFYIEALLPRASFPSL